MVTVRARRTPVGVFRRKPPVARSRYRRVAGTSVLALALSAALPGAAAHAAFPGIKAYLVRSGEMPGFVVKGAPEFATGATPWVTRVEDETGSRARRDTQTLRSAGFVAGAYENLRPKNGSSDGAGGSTVLQFKTPSEARKFVAKQYAEGLALQPEGAIIHPLKLAIKGGRGFTAPGSGAEPAGASNAYFSSGRCLFVVGDFIDGRKPNTGSPVAVAAKRVDKRVGGACR
jgi:hypothetical protein